MGNPVVWFEIGCKHKDKTSAFYGKLFGWSTQPYHGAAVIDTGSKEGIAGHISALGHEPHNYVTIYAQVDDLNRHLKLANELGARTLVPPTEVPGMGSFAWFADPEGNTVGLWKPAAQ